MAIDPEVLAKQRIYPVEKIRQGARPCVKCGAATEAKGGICRGCKNGYGLPDVTKQTTDRLLSYLEAIRAELKRRRDELDAALGEP